ncbi:ribbon-helix-helix protein, CopG family [Massilia sp.]|uniref:ribbon-helix-helix protein, CopG family n=1 Tax=Massilia sp. TaxID=1882437 RepID=UPI0028A7BA71|nr:ribbon-helix-helix protein, CopG family [Massilia sp.]
MTSKDVYIQISVKIHTAQYYFSIMDRGASAEGYLLLACSIDEHMKEKIPRTVFHHLDLDHVMQVRDAVIEAEKNSEFYIVRAGKEVFQDMSLKISPSKKPKKEKSFSISFNRELKAKFAEKCKRSGRSQSEAMRILMEYYLAHGIPALAEA